MTSDKLQDGRLVEVYTLRVFSSYCRCNFFNPLSLFITLLCLFVFRCRVTASEITTTERFTCFYSWLIVLLYRRRCIRCRENSSDPDSLVHRQTENTDLGLDNPAVITLDTAAAAATTTIDGHESSSAAVEIKRRYSSPPPTYEEVMNGEISFSLMSLSWHSWQRRTLWPMAHVTNDPRTYRYCLQNVRCHHYPIVPVCRDRFSLISRLDCISVNKINVNVKFSINSVDLITSRRVTDTDLLPLWRIPICWLIWLMTRWTIIAGCMSSPRRHIVTWQAAMY